MKTNIKILIGIFLAALIFPVAVRADAPPPPPLQVDVLFQGQKISADQFYAVLLTCQKDNSNSSGSSQFSDSFLNQYQNLQNNGQENSSEYTALTKLNISEQDAANGCIWKPYQLPTAQFCSNSQCSFGWVLGKFKVAVYLADRDKVFVSNSLDREYQGHYGSDTPRVYQLQLTSGGQASISATTGTENDNQNVVPANQDVDTGSSVPGPSYGSAEEMAPLTLMIGIFMSLLVTLPLELVVTLIFVFVRKFPKLIMLGTLIGNIISVPLLWIVVSLWYWTLIPSEIAAVVFEAGLLKLFGREKISWKWCLIISLLMNTVSFIFGPWLWPTLRGF